MSNTPRCDALRRHINYGTLGIAEGLKLAEKLEAELAQALIERKEWKTKFKDLDRSLACELRDPCGTIWEHAKKLQDKNDQLRDELEALKRENAALQGYMYGPQRP